MWRIFFKKARGQQFQRKICHNITIQRIQYFSGLNLPIMKIRFCSYFPTFPHLFREVFVLLLSELFLVIFGNSYVCLVSSIYFLGQP